MARSRERNTESSRLPVASRPIEPSAVIIPCSVVSLENARRLGSHGMHLHAPQRAGGPGGSEAPPRFEWIADAGHPTVPRRAKQRSQHPGKRVNMFVGIDVAHGKTARLNPPYLGDGLGLNLLLADAAAQQIARKLPTVARKDDRGSRDRAAKALRSVAGTGSRRPVPRDSRLPGAGWAKAI